MFATIHASDRDRHVQTDRRMDGRATSFSLVQRSRCQRRAVDDKMDMLTDWRDGVMIDDGDRGWTQSFRLLLINFWWQMV